VTLPQFLTEEQITKAIELYESHGMDAAAMIEVQVIAPNMAAINEKLGQENDARYLAYAVVYVFSQSEGN
jgi:phosphatidylserine/phosphatidylglycerophosphate/cardiolipin synthase-like enzyme